jgi:hypothetical protein
LNFDAKLILNLKREIIDCIKVAGQNWSALLLIINLNELA